MRANCQNVHLSVRLALAIGTFILTWRRRWASWKGFIRQKYRTAWQAADLQLARLQAQLFAKFVLPQIIAKRTAAGRYYWQEYSAEIRLPSSHQNRRVWRYYDALCRAVNARGGLKAKMEHKDCGRSLAYHHGISIIWCEHNPRNTNKPNKPQVPELQDL